MINRECHLLISRFKELGLSVDASRWQARSKVLWLQKVSDAAKEIATIDAQSEKIILVDDNQWGAGKAGTFYRCQCIPFLEHNGEYCGHPIDDAAAIAEIERQRENGATHIVFGWSAFWWPDYYPGMHNYLKSNYKMHFK